MPETIIYFYIDTNGSLPAKEWLDRLPEIPRNKGRAMLRMLAEFGHELRRSYVDFLRDGIYELRWRVNRVNYRLLYFFHGRDIVIVSHGFTKENSVPKREIDRAIDHRKELEGIKNE